MSLSLSSERTSADGSTSRGEGDDVVITDRGTPVARIIGIASTSTIERLEEQGVIGRPTATTRPVAGDRPRPTPKRPVADIVSEQRR